MRNILKSLKEILNKKIQLKSCWGQVGVRWVTGGKGGLETGRRPRSRHQEPSYPPNFIYPPHILGSFGALGVLSTQIYLSNSFYGQFSSFGGWVHQTFYIHLIFLQFSRWIVGQIHPLCQSFSLSTVSNFVNSEQNPNF